MIIRGLRADEQRDQCPQRSRVARVRLHRPAQGEPAPNTEPPELSLADHTLHHGDPRPRPDQKVKMADQSCQFWAVLFFTRSVTSNSL